VIHKSKWFYKSILHYFFGTVLHSKENVIQGGRQTTLKGNNDIKFARTVLIVN
jgi:hypothetical protein